MISGRMGWLMWGELGVLEELFFGWWLEFGSGLG